MTDHIAETMRMFNDLSWNLVNAPKDEIENTNKLCILITYMLDNFELGDLTSDDVTELKRNFDKVPFDYAYLTSVKWEAVPVAVMRQLLIPGKLGVRHVSFSTKFSDLSLRYFSVMNTVNRTYK